MKEDVGMSKPKKHVNKVRWDPKLRCKYFISIFFVDCRNTGVSYISFNHKCIKVCSSMKVSLLYISINYELTIILFHLQMMSILYFTYRTVCSPTRSSVSHCVNNSLFQWYIIQWL